jgi:hypothetical protein
MHQLLFDRVLAGLSIATCQRVGLPFIAAHFMFQLLKDMRFHLITGYGKSNIGFSNNDEGGVGQGMLQGSSLDAPIFLLNSEVSLQAYSSTIIGASFIHPISGSTVTDHCVQYVDETSQFVNKQGILSSLSTDTDPVDDSDLIHHAT